MPLPFRETDSHKLQANLHGLIVPEHHDLLSAFELHFQGLTDQLTIHGNLPHRNMVQDRLEYQVKVSSGGVLLFAEN